MNRGFIYLDIRIVAQILKQNAKRYFISHYRKMFFPAQNNFSIERCEKLTFITVKE